MNEVKSCRYNGKRAKTPLSDLHTLSQLCCGISTQRSLDLSGKMSVNKQACLSFLRIISLRGRVSQETTVVSVELCCYGECVLLHMGRITDNYPNKIVTWSGRHFAGNWARLFPVICCSWCARRKHCSCVCICSPLRFLDWQPKIGLATGKWGTSRTLFKPVNLRFYCLHWRFTETLDVGTWTGNGEKAIFTNPPYINSQRDEDMKQPDSVSLVVVSTKRQLWEKPHQNQNRERFFSMLSIPSTPARCEGCFHLETNWWFGMFSDSGKQQGVSTKRYVRESPH